jgi:16S rRNA (adenine1518-N6/adenine1519-N6)-dimethyltransferase
MKLHPKKRFGQHFLRDTGILRSIERLIKPAREDFVVEIGAGDGALSLLIAPVVSRLLAIEIDRDQVCPLESILAPFPFAEAVQADILQLDLEALLSARSRDESDIRIVGNLPYNIATAIMHRCLRLKNPIRDMTFMVQLEVAQRVVAAPGSRTYGYLSVDCQHRADVRLAFKVSPACFSPRPKVMSAIVVMKPRRIAADTDLEISFDGLVKAAFAHRRKTLANSLRRHVVFGTVSERLIMAAGIDGGRRAEDLSVGDYEHLALTYERLSHPAISRD